MAEHMTAENSQERRRRDTCSVLVRFRHGQRRPEELVCLEQTTTPWHARTEDNLDIRAESKGRDWFIDWGLTALSAQ